MRIERVEGRLELWLDRPEKRNAFSAEMRDALCEGLALAVMDAQRRARHRCAARARCSAAAAISTSSARCPIPATAHAIRSTRHPARLLHALEPRVECVVQGSCVGAGVELPAFAARVVARPDASFRLPELAMGLVPGAGGTVSLPRRIGRQRTAWLALTGAAIDVETALALAPRGRDRRVARAPLKSPPQPPESRSRVAGRGPWLASPPSSPARSPRAGSRRCAAPLAAPAPDAAAVAGTVRLVPHDGAPRGCGGGAYGDRRLRDVRMFDYSKPEASVVFLDTGSRPGGRVELAAEDSIAGARLMPKFAVVGAGGEVAIANRTRGEVVVSVPAAERVERIAAGSEWVVRAERAGPLEIFLLGAEEPARVWVSPGPWTRPDASGRFALTGLAAGPRHAARVAPAPAVGGRGSRPAAGRDRGRELRDRRRPR